MSNTRLALGAVLLLRHANSSTQFHSHVKFSLSEWDDAYWNWSGHWKDLDASGDAQSSLTCAIATLGLFLAVKDEKLWFSYMWYLLSVIVIHSARHVNGLLLAIAHQNVSKIVVNRHYIVECHE